MSDVSPGAGPLVVTGARQHNLRDVSVSIRRGSFTVITGPSGSGKSSLAFDTIYAEGQRRYVESLSAYARQFLDQLPKPDVDSIEGLSPAIAIQQKTVSRNPRSTVGTVTEIHDHLRLLYARAGLAHCPSCARRVQALTAAQMVDRVLAWPAETRAVIVAPLVAIAPEELGRELDGLRRDGFARVELDGKVRDLSAIEGPVSAETVGLQVDRLTVRAESRARIAESLELACARSGGVVIVRARDADRPPLFLSTSIACPEHGPVLPALEPQTFSFNSPEGACPRCNGLGEVRRFEPARIIPDADLSIADGAIAPWGKAGAPYHRAMAKKLTAAMKIKLETPWKRLRKARREAILSGDGAEWPGVIAMLETRARDIRVHKRDAGEGDDAADYLEEELGKFSARAICPGCQGARLRPEARAVTIGERSLPDIAAAPVRDARAFFEGLELEGARGEIAARVLGQIRARLGFLDDVGLGYLGLARASATLSGGEAARIRLATQIGAGLVGVLYVLDEPSVGLHAQDTERLLGTLRRLRDKGNTVLVVEHDEQTIEAADHVIDMGPGAGRLGGNVIAQGSVAELREDPDSVTGRYLAGAQTPPAAKRRTSKRAIRIRGARTHNLRGVDARLPLGAFTCVTGVSGSGKSSLIVDTLLPVARAALNKAAPVEVEATIEGLERLDKVIAIDQAPIGRTPRSNPATYSGVFTLIRELYGALPEARARGFSPGRFSFNVKGGRCEACKGDGVQRVTMHFLPDVFVKCETCDGRRYDRETLEVRYRGLSVADLLELTVDEALDLLGAIPGIRDRLAALSGVGLGYVSLGQSATTLSGGEAQRLKLAKELAKRSTGSTLFVLDEPTTGLHFGDVAVLLDALESLVDAGNTVVVIEHDLGVIARADHVVDLGPGGGDGGGAVVVEGTPEEVAACEASVTGRFLASRLR